MRRSHGATMLQALFPNTYIDANRHELDIDPDLIDGEWPVPVQFVSKSGLGLLKTVSRYGEPLQERKLTVAEVQHRLDRYFRPYHRELASVMDRMLTAHGFFYKLSCHCMSAVGAPTHADAGKERMDFCLGNLRGASSTCRFHRVHRRGDPRAGLHVLGQHAVYRRRAEPPLRQRRRYARERDGRDQQEALHGRGHRSRRTRASMPIQNVARAVLQAVAQRARERIGN